jgi:tetratricopeptide (TPR) repeat protein
MRRWRRDTLKVVVALAAVSVGPGLARAQAVDSYPEYAFVEQLLGQQQPSRGLVSWWRLEELWRSWDVHGHRPVVAELERLVASSTTGPWLREAARWRLAEARLRLGDEQEAAAAADELGVVRSFLIAGPLDNEGDRGLDQTWPPEQQCQAGLDLDLSLSLEGSRRPVSWRQVSLSDPLGVMHFGGFLQPIEQSCAYALSTVTVDRPEVLVVRVAAQGAIFVWFNDRALIADRAYRDLSFDRFAVEVRLRPGTHRLLAKVCHPQRSPQLALRVTDRRGRPWGAQFSNEPARARSGSLGRIQTRELETPFRHAWRQTDPSRRTAPSLPALRYLQLTSADDRRHSRLADAAVRVAEEARGGDRVAAALLAADLTDDRNTARRWLGEAMRLAGDEPAVLQAWARWLADGPDYAKAAPLLRQLLARFPRAVEARRLYAGIMARLGLPLAALARVEEGLDQVGQVPILLYQGAQWAAAARRTGRQKELLALRLRARHDDRVARRRLAELARNRGEQELALVQGRALSRVAWHSLDDRRWVAELLEQLGESDQGLSELARLTAQAPDSPLGWLALARLRAGAGQYDEALPPLRQGLALQPQNQNMRELLAHLQGQGGLEQYMEEPEVFLARRGEVDGSAHARWLLDLTVTRVLPSGLSSRFRQMAVEILDDEGARTFRSHGVAFVPGEQHVTLRRARVWRTDGTAEEASGRHLQQLNEPQVGMYYDEQAEVIELPRLRPGDVVEYAYRVDDVAWRNVMGDYWGDIALLQGEHPRRRVVYVLVHPAARQVSVEQPQLPSLDYDRSCDETECTLRWEALEVPPLPREDNQPALAELAGRLVLSTYDDWANVGRWYWGLAGPQLVPDQQLRRLVQDLVRDQPEPAQRVQAIHRWVVENTRYVALEFGIHGYQPYRVTQVLDRGFGDCKDKASLLVSMLGLAGIEASLVLLRTRHGGQVPPRPPSLALFDHAIAYVPALDLYLDGTAEQSGMTELPWMDQGVAALVVDRTGGTLVTTPIDPPTANRLDRQLEVLLQPGQVPLLAVTERIRGHQAAYLRFRYQAPALRRERLEAHLADHWPGSQLVDFHFDQLADREEPVVLRARWRAPTVAREQGAGEVAVELARPYHMVRRWARRSRRATASELGRPPHQVREVRRIVLPAGAELLSVPQSERLESPFGALTMELVPSSTEVVVTTELTMRNLRIEVGDYQAFRRFCRDVDRLVARRMVVRAASRP